MFQHTAARRRLLGEGQREETKQIVSTHSRAEAAADFAKKNRVFSVVSTHSRAEAAARGLLLFQQIINFVSTHSRAEAAAWIDNP